MSDSPKTITGQEVILLLNELRNNHTTKQQERKAIRNRAMAVVMLDAGLRVGELIQLKIEDLVFNCQPVSTIVVSAVIAKNKRERSIPTSQQIAAVIKEMLPVWWPMRYMGQEYFAFFSMIGSVPLTTRQVERIISSAAKRSIGRPVNPHVLRHTFGTRLMKRAPMRVVQQLLGHTSIASTQIYTHPDQDDLTNAINALD